MPTSEFPPSNVATIIGALTPTVDVVSNLPKAAAVATLVAGGFETFTTAVPEIAQQAITASVVVQATANGSKYQPADNAMNRIQCLEGADVTLRGRFTNRDRSAVLMRSSVTDITWQLFDRSATDRAEPVANGQPVVEDAMFEALQDDAAWTEDDVGFTFAILIPGDVLREGGRTYVVEVFFQTVSDGLIPMRWYIQTQALSSTPDYFGL